MTQQAVGFILGRERTQPLLPVRLIRCQEAHTLLDEQRAADERRAEKEAKRKARERNERAERDEAERIERLVANARALRAAVVGREDGPNVGPSAPVATAGSGLGCGAYVAAVLAVVASWVLWATAHAIVAGAGY